MFNKHQLVSHSITGLSHSFGAVVCGQTEKTTKLRVQAYFRRVNMQ